LLRGVNNIGMAKRVAMADVRALFERLGFRDVRTLLSSGNVVLTTKKRGDLGEGIEKALASRFGLACAVTILSGDEVASVVDRNPFVKIAKNPSCLLVYVPRSPAGLRQLEPLLDEPWSPEALALGRRVAYLWCANGVPRSPVWTAVDRASGRTGTVR